MFKQICPFAAVFFIILVILLAFLILSQNAGTKKIGGAGEDVIVDTLNLVHWLGSTPNEESLTKVIQSATPILKETFCGKVVFVIKDKDSSFNKDAVRKKYEKLAQSSKVQIILVEKYKDPPVMSKNSKEHTAKGRDDFYMIYLANKLRCRIVTADKLKDFERFRSTVEPFHTIEYNYWDIPQREYIMPNAAKFKALRRPKLINPKDVFAKEKN